MIQLKITHPLQLVENGLAFTSVQHKMPRIEHWRVKGVARMRIKHFMNGSFVIYRHKNYGFLYDHNKIMIIVLSKPYLIQFHDPLSCVICFLLPNIKPFNETKCFNFASLLVFCCVISSKWMECFSLSIYCFHVIK